MSFREALEDIASAQMLWHGGVGRRPYAQLADFITELQEIAQQALKEDFQRLQDRLDTAKAHLA